jgi:methionyl-tRNA formyltransferase
MPPSVAVFADAEVGLHCTQWLIENHKSDLANVVTTSQNEIYRLAESNGVNAHVFKDDASYLQLCDNKEAGHDLGLLLWWPKIISPSIICSTKLGFVNTHPSLLPFNRGKHYNFWALVEQCPFGVSLHLVEKGIDCGDLVAQKNIDYTWEDTGESLYRKAIAGMKELFMDTYPRLREQKFVAKAQDLSKGSFHASSELEAASKIALDETVTARQLLNLLRARTFEGHPACSFCDDGVEYEVRIKITKKK